MAECEMFLLKLVFLDKESKLYLLLYVDVCSRTAHLFYFRELKNIETNHEKNLYCVMNRKVTGHYFFAEKKKKNLLYKQTPVIMISKKVVII